MDLKKLTKEISERWHGMSPEEKKAYAEEAKAYNREHNLLHPYQQAQIAKNPKRELATLILNMEMHKERQRELSR